MKKITKTNKNNRPLFRVLTDDACDEMAQSDAANTVNAMERRKASRKKRSGRRTPDKQMGARMTTALKNMTAIAEWLPAPKWVMPKDRPKGLIFMQSSNGWKGYLIFLTESAFQKGANWCTLEILKPGNIRCERHQVQTSDLSADVRRAIARCCLRGESDSIANSILRQYSDAPACGAGLLDALECALKIHDGGHELEVWEKYCEIIELMEIFASKYFNHIKRLVFHWKQANKMIASENKKSRPHTFEK